MTNHALLSASSSHRWLMCTPSARLEDTMLRTTSSYAEEGTTAHEVAEAILLNKLGRGNFQINASEDMLVNVQKYIDVVESEIIPDCEVFIEKKLDYSGFAKEGFGTADCVIVAGGVLKIIDLKYGKNVKVDAFFNEQLMLYALGGIDEFSNLYNIKEVEMIIVQPRIDHISRFKISEDRLINWGEYEVIPKAEMAYKGIGDYVEGEHCYFCKAKNKCPSKLRNEFK